MWDQPALTRKFWLKFLHFVCCFCDVSSETWLTNVLEISTFAFLSGFFLFLCLGGCWCRDLPQYGHKQWQSYFGRTFDVYTKLWKFQQQHRSVPNHNNIKNATKDSVSLDTNTSSWHLLLADRQVLDTRYGLKRWQIGEVASKIGQLYYHY